MVCVSGNEFETQLVYFESSKIVNVHIINVNLQKNSA